MNGLKAGDVVRIEVSGFGIACEDEGKWVEIIDDAYYFGEEGYIIKEYCDSKLLTEPDGEGWWIVGEDSFGNNPMILLNTVEEQAFVKSTEHCPVNKPKHNHYFKDCPYDKVDVYRVLEMFSVTDACIQHATKKLLVAGGRGHKDIQRDIQDVIDTLERWKEMRKEEDMKQESK